MAERSGRCLCGAVSYHFTGEPIAARVCWCKDCQHIASNGTVNAVVDTDSLTINGELSEFISVAESGNQIRRRFCPTCGSHLFANSSARPQYTVVRIGTLDDPSSISPTMNIWTKSAPAWACFDENLPLIEGQAPPPKVVEK
ncbi:aldehyde-activating protein [Cellvibrio mixtus]|uniref:Aldehyde-activating protein n=1 Tax=Cellvibrio mixtus TaxID=39650 RepID=A0A266Q955_9GAMM|nr:GFA family protein [Cellvibrio mixtus]OZY86427.1 aldehyde-activating protein [Cellvibrio mixtus]